MNNLLPVLRIYRNDSPITKLCSHCHHVISDSSALLISTLIVIALMPRVPLVRNALDESIVDSLRSRRLDRLETPVCGLLPPDRSAIAGSDSLLALESTVSSAAGLFERYIFERIISGGVFGVLFGFTVSSLLLLDVTRD